MAKTATREREWLRTGQFHFGLKDVCTYCGEPATELEHVIPISYLTNSFRGSVPRKIGLTTYSCRQCNGILGANVFWTMLARLDFVENQYFKLSAKFGRAPEWADEQIVGLDYTLQTYIASKQEEMRRLDRKRSWRWSPEYMRIFSAVMRHPQLDPSSYAFVQFLGDFFEGTA